MLHWQILQDLRVPVARDDKVRLAAGSVESRSYLTQPPQQLRVDCLPGPQEAQVYPDRLLTETGQGAGVGGWACGD